MINFDNFDIQRYIVHHPEKKEAINLKRNMKGLIYMSLDIWDLGQGIEFCG